MDERQWIHAIQRGDRRYLQDIAEKYYDDIYRFCAFQTGSREEAYDMAQETFLRFIRYVEGYHDRNLKGYLLTIAMNVCRDHLRQRSREEALTVRCGEDWQWNLAGSSDSAGEMQWGKAATGKAEGPERAPEAVLAVAPERHVLEADIHKRLMQALALLPQMQREAILLHYLYDMKYREIGRLTDASVSTVKSRVRQGMERLQGMLQREDFLD